MQRIFEFTLEYATNYDNAALEYEQNFSEKNYLKLKIYKHIQNWAKETWIIPELKYANELDSTHKENFSMNYSASKILKLEKQKLNLSKKKLNGLNINIPENSKNAIKDIFYFLL